MRKIIFVCAVLYSITALSQEMSSPAEVSWKKHPLYAGVLAGYGSTTWEGLVPAPVNQNMAMRTSTPVMAREGGGVWGAFAGYELSPHFAVEANYMRYPKATILFDEDSLFAFENEGVIDLESHTETGSVMGKVMLIIPRTRLRFYSSAGIAIVHRWDNMTENEKFSPTFGAGFVYTFSDHIMAELGANYTAGYGESELNPAKDYVPFLYSGVFRLAYRI